MGDPAKVETPTLITDYTADENLECSEEGNTLTLTDERSIEHAETKSQEIIKKARIEAKKIIEEAMVKIEEEREIILEQARKNGFEEGFNQSLTHCEDIIQESGVIKQDALQECESFLGSIEDEVVSIVMDIARKVVGFEISFNREDILYIVRDSFKSCSHKEYVMLKVSEVDCEYIVQSKNKLLAMVQGVGDIEIKVDHSLEQGSCLIETPYGVVDGSVNTRLKEIEKVFRGLVGKE